MNVQAFYASFIATMAFGIVFNVPKKTVLSGGLIGMIGWVSFSWLTSIFQYNMVASTLIASFIVATLSQIFSRLHKMPVTVFSVAGIIPLVPGGLAYETMRHFIEDDYLAAIALATKTLLISGAIAFGLIFSGILSQTLQRKDYHGAKKSKKND